MLRNQIFLTQQHLLRILPASVDEAKDASSRNEIEMEKRLLASSTVKPSASISKEDLTKIVAAASKRAIDSLAQMSSAQIESNTGPEIAKLFSRLPTFKSMLAPDTKHLVVADEVSNQALSIEEERLDEDMEDAIIEVAKIIQLDDQESAEWAKTALSDVMSEQIPEFRSSVKDSARDLMKERLESRLEKTLRKERPSLKHCKRAEL